jgi:hypothetical protein
MLSRFLGLDRTGRAPQGRCHPARCRLALEELEARFAPSVTIGIIGTVLTANCDGSGNVVTLDHAGSFTVMNGHAFADSSFRSVAINQAPAGNDTADINGTVWPVAVNGRGGHNAVRFGISTGTSPESVQGILAPVTITNPPGGAFTNLFVDNSADPTSHNVTVSSTSIVGLAPAAINFPRPQDLDGVFIDGGRTNGTNTYTFLDTPLMVAPGNPQTLLYTNILGGSPATVNVQGTSGRLSVVTWAASSVVNVGHAGSVQNIRGGLGIAAGDQAPFAVINVDDSADPTARSVRLNAGSITGLAPAEIDFSGPALRLTVNGGRGGNSYTINNPITEITTLNLTGSGRDFVFVLGTTSSLTIDGGGDGERFVLLGNAGSVQGIRGVTVTSLHTRLTIDDHLDPVGRRWSVTDGSVSNGAFGVFFPAFALASLFLEGGDGGNLFTVTNTPNNANTVATTINSGLGGDDVSVFATTGPLTVNMEGGGRNFVTVGNGNMGSIRGEVTVNGHTRFLEVDNDFSRTADNVVISDHSIVGLAPAAINFQPQDLTALQIDGGNGGPFNVNNTGGGFVTTLFTGADANVVNVQGTTGPLDVHLGGPGLVNVGTGVTLAALHGPLAVFSSPDPGGPVQLNVDDQGSVTGQTYTITSTTVTRPGAALITYDAGFDLGLEGAAGQGGNILTVQSTAANTRVVIFPGAGRDTVAVLGTGAGSMLVLGGGGSGNLLRGPSDNDTWNITSQNFGTLSSPVALGGPVNFSSFQNLVGGDSSVDNTFIFSDGAGIDGVLDPRSSGNNTLDYSAYTSNVLVNLRTGQATGVGGRLANPALVRNVLGGNGGPPGSFNILVGNGRNVLTGGNDRGNLLVAGSSASTLIGGNRDDILIGGTTAYDQEADMASLSAVMAYWAGTADDYPTRIANLLSGSGVPLLDASMVSSNGGGNTLQGNGGGAGELNLFYGLDPTMETTDYNSAIGEVFINC